MNEPTIFDLNRRLESVERGLEKFSERVDRKFDELNGNLSALSFVNRDLYHSEMTAVRKDIENTHRLAMWSLGAVSSVVIGAIIIAILGASGVI